MNAPDPTAKGPIAWMAHNSVAANLLMLFLLIAGFLTISTQVKQEVFPDIERDEVTVTVPYPGAGPEEVEQGIVLAVEEAIRGVSGVQQVTATAVEGRGTISAELIEGSDRMRVYQDIDSEVARITTFPDDAEEAEVRLVTRRRGVASVIVFADTTPKALRGLAEEIRDRLLDEEEVTEADVVGVPEPEILIEMSQESLRRYGLTVQDVQNRLRAESIEMGSGGIDAVQGELLLRVKDRRDYGTEFARIPLVTNADGNQVLLGDVASVTDALEDADMYTLFDSRPAALIEVYRVGDQTPISVAGAVQEAVEEIEKTLPNGAGIRVLSNRADVFRDRLELLVRNGAIGLVLVFCLLGIFLELRLAFWVMLGIPVSFLGAMLLMPVFGLSINMLTMFAFIVALGIVVDDAIVVGENIYHHHQEGKPFLKAAVDGAREVAVPVSFSILTNIAAFIPLMMLSGHMGKLMWMLPVVVISAFAISWIESLFVLPAHLGHQRDRVRQGVFGMFHRVQQGFSHWFRAQIRRRYGTFLNVCIAHRYLAVAVGVAVLIVAVAYGASGRMGFELFPSVESDYAYGFATLPFGSPLAKTEAVARRMLDAADRVFEQAGDPRLREGVLTLIGGRGSNVLEIRAFLNPDAELRQQIMTTSEFVERWRKEVGRVPGVRFIRLQADRGGPGGRHSGLTVELRHHNIERLEHAARELAGEMENFPRLTDIDDGVERGKRQVDYRLAPEGQRLGLTSAHLARQLRNYFHGAEVLKQQRGRNEVTVTVKLPESQRVSEGELDRLLIRTPAGTFVPLAEVTDSTRTRAYRSIERRDGKRTLTVEAEVTPRSEASQVMRALDTDVMPGLQNRHPGLTYSYEGRQAMSRETMGSMYALVPIAMFGIYALLAIPFRSYVQPMIVMISIPFGVVGALVGHLIMGYQLSLIGVIGIVALSGVVVNDSLVLIDFANNERWRGAAARDAILNAGIQRFRPVMLTTLTTFGGLMPMITETSRQARFLIPMAISLGFGIVFATAITLALVPSLYMIVEDARWLLLGPKALAPAPPSAQLPAATTETA